MAFTRKKGSSRNLSAARRQKAGLWKLNEEYYNPIFVISYIGL